MPAGAWYPTIEQGADWSVVVTWTDLAGTPVVAQSPCTMELRTAAGALGVRLSAANGAIAIGAGTLTLALTAAQTLALAAGTYDYDLFATDPGGHPVRLLAGAAVVVARITQP